MSFQVDIAKYAKGTQSTLGEAVRAIKIELFCSVIRKTRVDTGRLRGNWQTSVGSPITTTIDRKDKISQGSDGGKAQDEAIRTVQSNTVDYLTNNLPYSEIYEEKDGMMASSLIRINRNIEETIRGL